MWERVKHDWRYEHGWRCVAGMKEDGNLKRSPPLTHLHNSVLQAYSAWLALKVRLALSRVTPVLYAQLA
jgi:hypothetical protein